MAQLMKRRGLSDVVTTVLIILLVLAAVAIIWGYLQGALKDGGKQIADSTVCLNLDLAPLSCIYGSASNVANVTYGRNAGEGTLTAVSLIFEYADGSSTVSTSTQLPGALETSANTTALSKAPSTFTVAGTVLGDSGDEKLCPKAASVTCVAA